MSTHKSNLWCVMKECNYNVTEKRHFFMFPKECDRWLQWIHASGRFDLQVMGPEYAHRNYRLCHLHFEEKWYKIGKCRASLLPNAVPTIFFGRNNTPVTSFQEENITEKD
ncbi:52 kDa repressor of the inhibitor of the protein kinase isoform X1 [Mycetomoellerius zeteki]|nr:PREDICTED: 52 kDa repressor of the inhibitor of the protein kinase-like isoform X1 [Trachymyrmex zeteki]XP_018313960.1 PREDICTED: 52 kDa repressor of the inhibitor of the protein kinase-like isoform X1 [Trachymyrmex zeteki]